MNLDCNSNTNVGIKINSKFDGKSSNSSTAVDVKFSSRILRFHTVNKDSGSPVANIESSSVAVFRINTRSDCTQSDRNLFTPTDNDKLVIVNIFVTLIICKSTVWVNFDKQKLDNSKKKNGKTDIQMFLPFISRFPHAILVSLPYWANSNSNFLGITADHYFSFHGQTQVTFTMLEPYAQNTKTKKREITHFSYTPIAIVAY